jgi:hypothetical protein
MNKRSFECQSANLENKTEFDSEKLAKLSKDEIVGLIEKNPDSRSEILKEIPNDVYWPKGADQDIIDQSEFLEEYGYKIGSTEVKDKETGKTIELDLYYERKKSNYNLTDNNNYKYDPKLESVYCKYYLIDKKGKIAGIMNIKNFSDNLSKTLIENYPENLLKKEFNLSKNLLKYGDDLNEKPKSFIHVDEIQSFKKGCGTVLHQVAVEHSLREGFEGRAQLYADYLGSSMSEDNVVTSAGFHENFGYFYKDVYDYNRGGELRHKGEDIHVALAKSRQEEAEKWEKGHLGEKMSEMIRDKYRPIADKSALIASLPEEIVSREKERMLKHQNLQINLETLDVLEKKFS